MPPASRGSPVDHVARHAQPGGGAVQLPEQHPEVHERTDRVQLELELGDDAEVAPAALERPQQVGVLVGGGPHAPPVGQHHLGRHEVVDGEPARAREPSHPAAEGEPADPGVADGPAGHREPVFLSGGVELGLGRATAAARPPGRGIDGDVVEPAQVDHQAVLGHRRPAVVVPAAAHADLQTGALRVAPVPPATSADDWQRAISAGRRSIPPFQTDRAAS